MIRIFAFCFLLAAIVACNPWDDITLEAGESFTDTNIRVFSIDTMTINFSTYKFDSIVFPGGDRILVGNYKDAAFGNIKASPFMELSPVNYSINNEGVYDSIVLVMAYDGYFYNDTLTSMTYNVHEVTQRIKPFEGDYFYNTNSFSYDEDVLGSITFAPKPESGDSIRIRLDDQLGNFLFDQIQGKDITDIDQLREAFKGLTIRSEENDNGSVIGFDSASDKTMLKIYYSVPEDVSEDEQEYNLRIDEINSPNYYFNHIESDRSNLNLNVLDNQNNTYSSTLLNSQSYVQAGVGIANRINIPYLKTLRNLSGDGTILNATLKIYVEENNYSEKLFLNDSLEVQVIDRHQNLLGSLTDFAEDNVYAILQHEDEFRETYYTIPLTAYLDAVMDATTDKDLSLTLLPKDYESSLQRIVFNNAVSTNHKPELLITYAIYNDEE